MRAPVRPGPIGGNNLRHDSAQFNNAQGNNVVRRRARARQKLRHVASSAAELYGMSQRRSANRDGPCNVQTGGAHRPSRFQGADQQAAIAGALGRVVTHECGRGQREWARKAEVGPTRRRARIKRPATTVGLHPALRAA